MHFYFIGAAQPGTVKSIYPLVFYSYILALAELSLGVQLTLLKNQTVTHAIYILTIPSSVTKSVFLAGMLLKLCLNFQAVI